MYYCVCVLPVALLDGVLTIFASQELVSSCYLCLQAMIKCKSIFKALRSAHTLANRKHSMVYYRQLTYTRSPLSVHRPQVPGRRQRRESFTLRCVSASQPGDVPHAYGLSLRVAVVRLRSACASCVCRSPTCLASKVRAHSASYSAHVRPSWNVGACSCRLRRRGERKPCAWKAADGLHARVNMSVNSRKRLLLNNDARRESCSAERARRAEVRAEVVCERNIRL